MKSKTNKKGKKMKKQMEMEMEEDLLRQPHARIKTLKESKDRQKEHKITKRNPKTPISSKDVNYI